MTTFDDHLNFARGTVVTPPTPATSGLTIGLNAGAPTPTPPFNAVVCPATERASYANAEIVRVTARVGDDVTIEREQESTTARAIVAGDQFYAAFTDKPILDIEQAIVSLEAAMDTVADQLAAHDAALASQNERLDILGVASAALQADLDAGLESADVRLGVLGLASAAQDVRITQASAATDQRLDALEASSSAAADSRLDALEAWEAVASAVVSEHGVELGVLALASAAADTRLNGNDVTLTNHTTRLGLLGLASAAASAAITAQGNQLGLLGLFDVAASAAISALDYRLDGVEVTLAGYGSQILSLGAASATASAAIGATDVRAGQASAAIDARLDLLEASSSAAADSRLDALEAYDVVASAAISVGDLRANQASAATDARLDLVEAWDTAASAAISVGDLRANQASAAADTRLDALEAYDSTASAVISAQGVRVGILATASAAADARITILGTASAAADARIGILGTASAAAATRLTSLETASAGLAAGQLVQDAKLTALAAASAYADTRIGVLGIASAGFASGQIVQDVRLTALATASAAAAVQLGVLALASATADTRLNGVDVRLGILGVASAGLASGQIVQDQRLTALALSSGAASAAISQLYVSSGYLGTVVFPVINNLAVTVQQASAAADFRLDGLEAASAAASAAIVATRYDTAPIGTVIEWTRRVLPPNGEWAYANGASYPASAYPDAYAAASAEVVAGNPLWTIGAGVFTVPNLTDQFVYGTVAASAVGVRGGASAHTLDLTQIPSHNHAYGTNLPGNPSTPWSAIAAAAGGSFWATTSDSNVVNDTATDSVGGGLPHNNMPPFVRLAYLVKLKGVTVGASAIQGPQGIQGPIGLTGASGVPGPTGASGVPGATGGNASAAIEAWHIVGAVGEPAFQNSWANFTGTGMHAAAFRKDPWGVVHLRGQVQGGTPGSTIFTLPAGYRPSNRIDPAMGGASPSITGAIVAAGDVIPATGNTRIGLDGIFFDTDLVTSYMTGPQGASGVQGPTGPTGPPGASGVAVMQRGVVGLTTPSLAVGASALVSAPLGASFGVVGLRSDRPAWLRLYASQASAVADAGRASAAAIPEDAGVLLDYVFPTSSAAYPVSPVAWGATADGASAVAGILVNQATQAGSVRVDITEIPLENSLAATASAAIGGVPLVSVLPGSPVNGQEIYYQDATLAAAGITWRFRYNAFSASAYKWEAVGRQVPLALDSLAQVGPTSLSASTFGDIVSALTLTAPLAGDYETECGAAVYNGGGGVSEVAIGIKVGAVEPSHGSNDHMATADTIHWANLSGRRVLTGLAAATVLTLRFLNGSGGNAYRTGASLRIAPTRVG